MTQGRQIDAVATPSEAGKADPSRHLSSSDLPMTNALETVIEDLKLHVSRGQGAQARTVRLWLDELTLLLSRDQASGRTPGEEIESIALGVINCTYKANGSHAHAKGAETLWEAIKPHVFALAAQAGRTPQKENEG